MTAADHTGTQVISQAPTMSTTPTPAPAPGTKVFLQNIPTDALKEELEEVINPHGQPRGLVYMKDAVAGSHKGWAYADYEDKIDAEKVVAALNGRVTMRNGNKALEVAIKSTKEFSSFAPVAVATPQQTSGSTSNTAAQIAANAAAATAKATNPSAVAQAAAAATQNARQVLDQRRAAADKNDPNTWHQYFTPKGDAYYHCVANQQTTWEKPAGPDVVIIPARGNQLPTEAASVVGSSAYGPPGSNLFVFHIPNSWTEHDLYQHFKSFGNLISTRIQREASGRTRGFGFVSYDSAQGAATAISGMNGFHVEGKWLQVQLKKGEEKRAAEALAGGGGAPGAAVANSPPPSARTVTPVQDAAMQAAQAAAARAGGGAGYHPAVQHYHPPA